MSDKNLQEYWKKNLRLLKILLLIWFFVSYGCGMLFVDFLNQFRIGGYKLGFWFAQQGAIYCFILIIFVYVKKMNDLDKEYGVSED
jgi:putative solute:sodium symporter small subunit